VRDLSLDPGSAALVKPMCDDPSLLVRLDAAWGLHDARDRANSSYRELVESLAQISDQPAGALRQTQFAMDEHRIDDALDWSAKAAAWTRLQARRTRYTRWCSIAPAKPSRRWPNCAKPARSIRQCPASFMLALLCGETGQTGELIAE